MSDYRLLENGTDRRLLENGTDLRILETSADADVFIEHDTSDIEQGMKAVSAAGMGGVLVE